MRMQLNWHGGLAAAAAQPLLKLSLHRCAQQRELCSAVWNTLHQSGFGKAQQQPAAAGSAWRVQHAGVVQLCGAVSLAQQLPHFKARVHLTAHSQLACAQRRNGWLKGLPCLPPAAAAVAAAASVEHMCPVQGSWAGTVRRSARCRSCGRAPMAHAGQHGGSPCESRLD